MATRSDIRMSVEGIGDGQGRDASEHVDMVMTLFWVAGGATTLLALGFGAGLILKAGGWIALGVYVTSLVAVGAFSWLFGKAAAHG